MISIKVPQHNDSFIAVTIDDKRYLLRFTYNDTFDYWSFGIYDIHEKPIIQGLKIVPNFPLNLQYNDVSLPKGYFIALSKEARIGHNSFTNGNAEFVYKQRSDS